ncbi:MAG: GIY-YIG nuclease family protein [Lacibacter sp.]|nr:GIY-YIG nuclease family protein [Lacibacter sp.]
MKGFSIMVSYCYILYSAKLNKYYVGSTSDMERRFNDHNRGKEKFTSTGMPWKLVYSEPFDELAMARRRELEIKKKKSRKYIEQLISSVG